ncbi:CRISPR-associated endonuclease Cas1 [Planctellipticum variicoloris]|uniref:CRISPR-associated endonuclease Cas4g/Cas1g n=1 Tax=Planctellipticum variicoloris TaxID=3064265 RepID=UPI0030133033|nr:CRISPR-associated endonuclease Cas1 [Planctomycetaceae bacterium SH412]
MTPAALDLEHTPTAIPDSQGPKPGSAPAPFDLEGILTGEGTNAVASDAELVPARMLNEFAYCPRLAYLEWVQGEFEDNLVTREGTFGHRNVDRPSCKPVPSPDELGDEDDPPPQTSRALMLSSYREGLLAKLDIVELEGRRAVPVDYKRGTVPDSPHQAWEPERVQLCAQGLILRDNGYACDYGELYFIESRRRVVVPFDDVLIMRTRQLVGDLRRMAEARKLPPPLVDSPKCPRCSLVGICLPDETNWLRESRELRDESREAETERKAESGERTARREPEEENAKKDRIGARPVGEVRKLLPARDDARPLYVQEQGATLGKDGERLIVRSKDGSSTPVPLINVSQVSVFGNAQMSAPVLREIVSRGISICHFSYGGWFHAMTTGLTHKNVELRMAQFAAAGDPAKSLPICRAFIAAKIRNQRTMLRRHGPESLKPDLDRLAEWIGKAERATSAESLMGIEGMSAKVYFAGFAKLFKGPQNFTLEGRNRRPPTDPINALLSFVYALLMKDLTVTLQSVGFDPMLGFLHQPRYGRPSLALDLAEEFRPLIGDSVVLTLVNNGEVSANQFVSRAGSVALTDTGRKAVLAAYERRMEHEITHPIFRYKLSYRRVLEVQARLLSRVLQGDLPEYPGFCTR